MYKLSNWSALSEQQRHQVSEFTITEQQQEYAGSIANAIQKIELSNVAEVIGLTLLKSDIAVGFLLLKKGSKAPIWVGENAASVHSITVDSKLRGQGVGSAMLALLPNWVRQNWPDIQRLVLFVDEDNVAAIRVYEKANWQRLGER